jgi:hypothetical protein
LDFGPSDFKEVTMRINVEDIVQDVDVNVEQGQIVLTGRLRLSIPLPNERVPDQLEDDVEQAGQAIKRVLLGVLLEQADREEVLRIRHGRGGKGIQQRGTRRYPFKARCGTVVIQRQRIMHCADYSYEVPSATAWNTPRREYITQGLRDAVCDEMRDRTVRRARDELATRAMDDDLLGKSTVVDIVHEEGSKLIEASRQRALGILKEMPEARRLLPEPKVADTPWDPEPDEDLATDISEDEEEEVVRIAMGFLGTEPTETETVLKACPREVDEGFVCLEPDEVKVKAQGGGAAKEHWLYTATMMVGSLRYYFVEATADLLWVQVASVLCLLGVAAGDRQLLVLGDGAIWIRNWFTSLQLRGKVMVLCWYHLAKRCYQRLSAAGLGSKERRQAVEHELLDHLWVGEVDKALSVLARVRDEVRNPKWIDDMANYLEKRRAYIPNYSSRHKAGLWIASNRVEKWNDWAVSDRCKRRGMSWQETGVLSLAAFQAARRNEELDTWRAKGDLSAWRVPQPTASQAA